MRALQFKITLEHLVLRHWNLWKREDQDFIRKEAGKLNINWWIEDNEMVFAGNHEQLYGFMYNLAYRYDIELI